MLIFTQRLMAAALAVGLTISLSVLFPATGVPIKAGASCPKPGASKTVAGKKLVCVKAGKKQVWQIKKATKKPAQSAGSTDSTKPTETIDNNWYGWSFRISNDVLERKGGPVTNWSSAASRSGQVIDPIRAKAFENIKAYQAQAELKPVIVNFHFSPNVAADVEAAFRVYFKQSQEFFASRIPTGTVLEVVIATEKDDVWRKAKLLETLPTAAEAYSLYDRESVMFEQFRSLGIRFSGGGSVTGTSELTKLIYAGSVCSCFKAENLLMSNVPHEMTHYFQFAVTPGVPKQNYRTIDGKLTEGKIYVPHSLMEGSANTFGSAITVKHVGWYSDQLNWNLGRYKRDGGKIQLADTAEVISLLNKSESYLPSEVGLNDYQGVIGQLAYEYYVATYGVKAYFELFDNIYKLRDFDLAIKETIGITKAEFYAAAAPYVLVAFNSVSR
jgi:hypothetical protein